MSRADSTQRTAPRRGRPSKFGRPSRVVALTLPEDAIQALRRVHRDIGWAIVKLIGDGVRGLASRRKVDVEPDVELVAVADRRYLIVINQDVIQSVPGVNIVPLSGTRAFLALDVDRGMSDLELAVIDRLHGATLERRERRALTELRTHLRAWRGDPALRFHRRAIIVVERRAKELGDAATTAAKSQRRASAKTRALPPGQPAAAAQFPM